MLFPGTYTAEQAAAIYEKTAANRESITDWTGNWNSLCNGGNCSTTSTNSASKLVASYNLTAPGSSEDLENAAWIETDATINDATTFTPTAADGQVVASFTGVSGAAYLVSATIASAGNTDLEWTLDGVETAVAVTASEARYSIAYTGDGAAANIGLRDPAASGYGAITFTDIQVERVPTGTTTPLPYQDSAEPVFQCASCDFDGTDDYGTSSAAIAGANPRTYIAVVKTDAIAAGYNRIIASSTANQSELAITSAGLLAQYCGGGWNALGTGLSTSTWTILGSTYNGATLTGYVNGASASSASCTSEALTGTTIGKRGGSASDYFNGQIPLVLIEDRAMTARELIGNGSCSASSTASESRLLRQCGLMGKIAWEMWNERAICVTGYRALGFCASVPTELP